MKRATRYRDYRKEVSRITRENLPPKQDWHDTLDHIVPISKAFQWGIPPELVGSRENLVWISWNANIGKGTRITPRAIKLIRKWGYTDLAESLELKRETKWT